MKAVMKSVSPQICEKITSGNCTLLVSKTAPKCDAPFKGYIYCTKAKSQWRYSDYEGAYQNSEGDIVYAQRRVIGEFICDEICENASVSDSNVHFASNSSIFCFAAGSQKKIP